MTASPHLDTLLEAARLQEAGLRAEAAAAVVKTVETAAENISNDLAGTFASRESQQVGFAEIRTEIARLRTEMAQMRADIMRMMWLQAIGITGVLGTLVALLNLL